MKCAYHIIHTFIRHPIVFYIFTDTYISEHTYFDLSEVTAAGGDLKMEQKKVSWQRETSCVPRGDSRCVLKSGPKCKREC